MHAEDTSIHNANVTIRPVPPYSPQAFLDYLVRFIVSDDQVYPFILYSFMPSHIFQSIRIIECPEFREMCMVLCATLEDAQIPHRDKVRESVISCWQQNFEELKLDLSVC